jgi:hypothetical protein
MATLKIELSDAVRTLAETRARESGHATLDAYVESLIQSDWGIDYGAPAELDGGPEQKLIELLDEAEATPFAEMTRHDWDGLREKVIKGRGPVGA